MASNRNFIYFFKNLSRKHRLSLHNQHDESEIWYMFISPLKMIAVSVAVLLLLFILILTLVAYTPILNLIPGYSGNKQREQVIQNILRVDSIEQRLNDIEAWGHDVSLIMEGKTPYVRDVSRPGDSVAITRPEPVSRSREDSLLRQQMEGGGAYGLNRSGGSRIAGQADLQPPVHGLIVSHFSPKDGRFGTGITTAAGQQILAIAEGTVTLVAWSPEDGYIIQVQHSDNLLSVYKHFNQSLVTPGSRVRKSEALGVTGEGAGGEAEKTFVLELWHNGTPVDPEKHILF